MREFEPLRLVAISPGIGTSAAVIEFTRAACAGGVTAIWLRERARPIAAQLELATQLRRVVDAHDAILLVSGADARLLDAGGHALQLGRHEPAPARVRAALGAGAMLGASVHDPIDTAVFAAVDFVVLAPVFAVPGKGPAHGLERFGELARGARVPVVGLGGVDATNAAAVIAAGACGVAVQRGIAGDAAPEAAARRLRRVLDALA